MVATGAGVVLGAVVVVAVGPVGFAATDPVLVAEPVAFVLPVEEDDEEVLLISASTFTTVDKQLCAQLVHIHCTKTHKTRTSCAAHTYS